VRHGHLPEREIMTGIGPAVVRHRDMCAAPPERYCHSEPHRGGRRHHAGAAPQLVDVSVEQFREYRSTSSCRSWRWRQRFWVPGSRHWRRWFDEREQTARAPVEDERGTIAILHVGRMNDDVQQEAEYIDENMPLAAHYLLARIETVRVERAAPF
jgi:hypothetical protein